MTGVEDLFNAIANITENRWTAIGPNERDFVEVHITGQADGTAEVELRAIRGAVRTFRLAAVEVAGEEAREDL